MNKAKKRATERYWLEPNNIETQEKYAAYVEGYNQAEQDDWELVAQKSAKWDKEDENMFKSLETLLNTASCYSCTEGVDKILSWLKSIKDRIQPQPKQEWNEEDERLFGCLIKDQEEFLNDVYNDKYGHSEIISDLKDMYHERIDWLKSLKDRIKGE